MPQAPQAPVGFETVLGANSVMEGVLRSNANVRLDGTFTGTLEITGNVLIGETARINADVNAKNISIAGAVRGNVTGKKVQLLRTGRIWGDIHATALTTEEGAFIDGKIAMVGYEQPQVEEEPVELADEPPVASFEQSPEVVDEPPIASFEQSADVIDVPADEYAEEDEPEIYIGEPVDEFDDEVVDGDLIDDDETAE
ncbi:MAG: polymer-forming cytoskeletal protein [Anaerolineae bacterium]|nr:polymer-forming cytoskeletal protein [Anaerolineae bacterium]